MKKKINIILIVGFIIGYMIISNVVFYHLGQNTPHSLEGYRLREYGEEMNVWASEQFVDGFIIQGDSLHPARFIYEITSPSALSFKVFSQRGDVLYTVSNAFNVYYEQEITSPQEIFIDWSVIQTAGEREGYASILQYNISIWEWMAFAPELI